MARLTEARKRDQRRMTYRYTRIVFLFGFLVGAVVAASLSWGIMKGFGLL